MNFPVNHFDVHILWPAYTQYGLIRPDVLVCKAYTSHGMNIITTLT